MVKHLLIVYIFLLINSCSLQAQDSIVPQKGLVDFLSSKRKILKLPLVDTLVIGKFSLSFLPIVSYDPALGFVAGVGISAGILNGKSSSTHPSSILANTMVTTKQQLNIFVRSNIYTKNDAWIFQGDWRLLLFSQSTYGLGINFSDRKQLPPVEQPMNFNYIRFYEYTYHKLVGSWYAGLGINIDRHYSIKDQLLDTIQPNINFTSHYRYSVTNSLPLDNNASVGISANFLFDSRDNAVNPLKGQYALLSFRMNKEFLGSTRSSNILAYDYRYYWPVSGNKKLPQIIAFWSWAQFLASGKQPYLDMPSITWDMYSRSGRGYVQGRIRGENILYAETEYRFPISKNGLLGGVAFFNITTATNDAIQQKLGYGFAEGYGAGIRIKLNKKTNTNIAIDYGRGRNGLSGVYFNLQETF